MAYELGSVEGAATVQIDYEKCSSCGLCLKVCRGGPFCLENRKVSISKTSLLGCVACGQCMAICPLNCITVSGRGFSPADMTELPSKEKRATYEELSSLLLSRRSIRDFKDKEVGRDVIEHILDAASTAPMGVPPSDVRVLVLAGKPKVKEFKDDILKTMNSVKWMFSSPMLALYRPFIGKESYDMYKSFVMPVLDAYAAKDKEGVDWFFYDAPLALYFYGSAYSDAADPYIAATYAMLAAESLGLGSCMLGFPAYILKYGNKLKRKYHLPKKMQPGIVVVFGYPALKYQRAIKRRFAEVNYH